MSNDEYQHQDFWDKELDKIIEGLKKENREKPEYKGFYVITGTEGMKKIEQLKDIFNGKEAI